MKQGTYEVRKWCA